MILSSGHEFLCDVLFIMSTAHRMNTDFQSVAFESLLELIHSTCCLVCFSLLLVP